jgi:hypothetical protein
MKKTIFSVMFAMILGTVVCSCGNASTPVAGAGVDSTLVDSAAIDSAIVDSLGQVVADSVCAE